MNQPLTHVRTFRVRHYECDVHGYVNQANFLRYMQEAAFDASAAAGYDHARYDAIGSFWLIRETEIEYLLPLRYGESVQIKTWVADFRRVRSRRAYEIRYTESGRLVARAHTDWVFLDQATMRPSTIPPEMKQAFYPHGFPEPAPPREKFPSPPIPHSGLFRQQRRVEWRDLDAAGHVNNSTYLAYIEDCGLQAAANHGWPVSRMETAGFVVTAHSCRIEYLLPALLDDELEVATWLSDVEPTGAIRHSTITRRDDGTLLARARTIENWVDPAGRDPVSAPAEFLDALAPYTTDGKPAQD